MAAELPVRMRWGIGVAFIVGMVVTLILAIQTFEGPTSVILLVVSGVFLLVGLYFLTGTMPGPEDAIARPSSTDASSSPTTPEPPPGPSFMPAATARRLVTCKGCKARVADTFRQCPHCGTAF